MTPRKSFESNGFDCDFCPGSYMHKGSKITHIKKKHTITLTEAVKLTIESSIEKSLNDDIEVLEEAGVAVDLLDMDPMEEFETLEENVDTVQTNVNELSQSAILATTDVIESVLNMVHSTTPLQPSPPQCPPVLEPPPSSSLILSNQS